MLKMTDAPHNYSEVKKIIKTKQQNPIKQNHPHYNRNNPYHLLTRHEQFRLTSGHYRLRIHLFHKLKIGDTDQFRCRTGSQTTEHPLHFCPNHESLRQQIWPDPTPMSLEDLQRTATFDGKSGETI